MLQIDEIRTLREFEALHATWHELQQAAGARSVFLSHEWFLVCAQCLSPNQQMLVLVLRREGRPVGAVPLLSQRIQVRHLPATQIGFLENPLTPFVDFLLTEREEGLRTVLGYFRETHTDWDVLSLGKLREDSPHLDLLRRLLGHQRQTFRVLEVSQRSWKRQQAADLLTPEFERKFLGRLTGVVSNAGWLRLWLLKKGEDVLAAEYHLDDHGAVYALRAHYDDAYAASSPGAYLDTMIVRHLFENGCTLYDMGPGRVDYKLAWTNSVYCCYSLEIYNQTFYSQLLGRLETRWIPALKASPLGRWLEKRPEPIE